MSQEVELKFDIAAADVAALKACAALAGATPEITEAETAYFDTKDGRVRNAGYSLRVRKSGGRCSHSPGRCWPAPWRCSACARRPPRP
jgi:inorganic triphosphatase YgiF